MRGVGPWACGLAARSAGNAPGSAVTDLRLRVTASAHAPGFGLRDDNNMRSPHDTLMRFRSGVCEVPSEEPGRFHAFLHPMPGRLRAKALAMRAIVWERFAVARESLVRRELVQVRRIGEERLLGLGHQRPGRRRHRRAVDSILLAMQRIIAGAPAQSPPAHYTRSRGYG